MIDDVDYGMRDARREGKRQRKLAPVVQVQVQAMGLGVLFQVRLAA